MANFILEDDNVRNTNTFINSYMKTLPLPFKHFVVYSLKEGIIWGPYTLEEIAKKFDISLDEATKIYQEALEMLSLLDKGMNNNR